MSVINYTIISNKDINILYEEETKSGTVFYNTCLKELGYLYVYNS